MTIPLDFYIYKKIILGGINSKNYHEIDYSNRHKYKNYTKYIQTGSVVSPKTLMIGYKINTIDGYKWMPVFSYQFGDIRSNVNREFTECYKNRIKNSLIETLLYNYNIPLELIDIIISYIYL